MEHFRTHHFTLCTALPISSTHLLRAVDSPRQHHLPPHLTPPPTSCLLTCPAYLSPVYATPSLFPQHLLTYHLPCTHLSSLRPPHRLPRTLYPCKHQPHRLALLLSRAFSLTAAKYLSMYRTLYPLFCLTRRLSRPPQLLIKTKTEMLSHLCFC